MLSVLVLAATMGLALGGQSPGASYIDQFESLAPRFSENVLEDGRLNVPGLVAKYGYPIEVHNVVTTDGYGLTMHRIPYGRDKNNQPGPRPVVFIMHGLMSSSAEFVIMGPGNALAYVLAEEGYDVWLGNARGNFYSRRHQTLNPNWHRAYWRFSWDEIGNLDLPACFDHIEQVTGQDRYHYIGHSQGGTTFLVLNALHPEYAHKFISFQGLAPGAFFLHNENPQYVALKRVIHILDPAIFAITGGEVMANREWVTWFSLNYCYEGSIYGPLCHTTIANQMTRYFNVTMIPVILGHSPAGASIRQFTHYGQLLYQDLFRRYDYGMLSNLQLYGSVTPPDYDLSRVIAPSHLHYSSLDAAANYRDVELLASRLPNAFLHKIPSPFFGHYDFVWGIGVRWTLYERVIELMREAERNV